MKLIDLIEDRVFHVYSEGDTLIMQGKKVDSLIYIINGSAKIFHQNSKGRQFVFLNAGSGDYLGIHSMINNSNSYVSVVATENTTAYVVERKHLDRLRLKSTQVSISLIKLLCSKIGKIESKISKAVSRTIRQEIARILLLKDKENINGFSMTVGDLAVFANTTNNYIYKVLSELENSHAISITGKRITVLDNETLNRVVEDKV
jgi:CRP-like cAMP-binding protein